MVNVQQWLFSQEQYNTKEKRAEVRQIHLTEPELAGELDLEEFTYEYGVKVYISLRVDASKLTFTNQPEKAKIIKLVRAQEWLDKNYPLEGTCQDEEDFLGRPNKNFGKTRAKITKLNIYCENLTGELKLTGFSNLRELECQSNQLTNLDFLSQLNPAKLTKLAIFNNNFPATDLSVFSHLVNLEELYIGSDISDQIKHGIYNRFTGSLAPLQSLTKLRTLDISDTDINSGLEYLSDSLESFYCSTKLRPTALSQQLINQLIIFGEPEYSSDYTPLLPVWKQAPKWKQQGFSEQEIKKWTSAGLLGSEYDFTLYLKQQGYTPETINLTKNKNKSTIMIKLTISSRAKNRNYSLRY